MFPPKISQVHMPILLNCFLKSNNKAIFPKDFMRATKTVRIKIINLLHSWIYM